MNFKRIAVFLSLMLAAAAFCITGARLGSSGNVTGQNAYAASGKRETEESEKIAVVNLDEGVPGDDGWVNYAERLSRFPCMDFEYASLEAARMGLETGKYGAYVIIPAVFSQNVESINVAPQVSRLEYAVNQTYSGRRQYELLYHVWSYIDSLNNHLSYMYVDNILKEFHDAQDGAGRVLENDLRDLEAMEKIRAQDLVTLVEMPEMPKEEEMPETPDISGYMARSSMLAESVNAGYESRVREIRAEIDALNADGDALAERLEKLAGQAAELDLAVDGSGENIAEKAERQLRAELERQSEHALEKEMMIEHLTKLKDSNEKLLQMFRQSDRVYPEGNQPGNATEEELQGVRPGNTAEEESQEVRPGNAAEEELQAGQPELQDEEELLLEQAQELEFLLGETNQAENPDIDKITELVRREYIDPMNLNAKEAKSAFRQRYEEEIAAVVAYNGRLAGFRPQMDNLFLVQYIQEQKENHKNIQKALLENNQAYIAYAQKSTASAREYADQLQKHTAKAQEASAVTVEEGLSAAKKVKEKSRAMNQRILGDFSSKLPYTRLGSTEYTRVYQFIANPLSASDRSAGQTASDHIAGCPF